MKIEPPKNITKLLRLLKIVIGHNFWSLVSNIRYKKIYFLDTNIVVLSKNELDCRVKKLKLGNKKFLVTNTINKEIKDLINSGLVRVGPKCDLVTFNNTRERFPDICPLYYNLISKMYNPANIASPEFFINLIQSKKLKNMLLDKNEDKLYMRSMNRLKEGAENNLSYDGKEKTPMASHIDAGAFKYFQKKMRDKDSPNLMNDYRNIALIIIYTLLNKTNTTFVTADHDVLPILYNYSESLAQHSTLHYFILPSLSEQDKKDLFSGKSVTRLIDFKEFKEFYEGTLRDILNPFWKKDRNYFRVMFWDGKTQKYYKDVYINFDNLMRETALNMHGPMSCNFAKNCTHGNWLHYQYFWPPKDLVSSGVRVIITLKKIFLRKNIYVPDHVHLFGCKYAQDDVKDNLKGYLGFT